MARNLYSSEPVRINYVQGESNHAQVLEIATRNKDKLKEYQRILKSYEIIGKDLKVDEIQSLDSIEVVSKKAVSAWEKNGYNPILVEDVSLEIMGLGGRPGPYVNDYCSEVEMRRMIAEVWLKDKDRRASARVLIAIYDGIEIHVREGKVSGTISESLRGTNGFGWDDMFIPTGSKKTFAEMTEVEKDKYSMRKIAIEKLQKSPVNLSYPVYMIPEPYDQELARMRIKPLQENKAIKFAYALECLKENKMTKEFLAPKFKQINKTSNKFFSRFIQDSDSMSLGLLLTDIDRSALKFYKNNEPIIWQMGPRRRHLALAERAEYFLEHQNKKVHLALDNISLKGVPTRVNTRSATIESALGTNTVGDITQTKALKEIGYKKVSSTKNVSRSAISENGLYNKVGKYPRSIFGLGSMPPISGWRDVLVTAAVGHMPVFTHRNSLNALDFDKQVGLIREAKKVINSLSLGKEETKRAELNIGAAMGCSNIKDEMHKAKRLYKEAGVKLFRIYTINSDPRVIEMARELRQYFGDEIEIFVGQVTDKRQTLELIDDDIKVDGLIFGHGGGMQCTSATNGMALTTLEEIYEMIKDPRFNNVSIVAEGGVGKSVGALLIMGVDLILCNQKLVHGTIELGDIFFEHKSGKPCQPYHGSASAPTMLIESLSPELMENRMYLSGRAKKIEGSPGYMFYEEKANSMSFYVNEFKHYAARTLADLGVSNFQELREFLRTNTDELLRIISQEASFMGNVHTST